MLSHDVSEYLICLERLLGEAYDFTSDIWSVGILIVHLWTKLYPFETCSGTPIDLLSELESISIGKP